MNESNHLILENITDLLKISPAQLKKAHYSDFSGKYFEQINKEVIKSEAKNIKPIKEKINIKEINNNINNTLTINRKQKNIIGYIINKSNNPIQISGYNNYYKKEEESYQINKIVFNIYYNTLFGQEIAIAGSNNKLGRWDKNNLFFLKWTEGNIWVGELDLDGGYEDFEFKFVLCYNKNIIAWEPGDNNNVYFTALLNEIKDYQKGRYNKYEYDYNINEGILTLNCQWPK